MSYMSELGELIVGLASDGRPEEFLGLSELGELVAGLVRVGRREEARA